jgi:hypothetical protein
MAREHDTISRLFRALMKAPRCKFPEVGEKLEASRKKGVYIIFHPRGRVLHVGSTPRAQNGIAQRLRNHMQGQSSFTQRHFKSASKKKGSQLRGRYSYSCVPVSNPRQRALLEAYSIGVLCPKHIGHGSKSGEIRSL